jgi:hypothetical protein
MQSCGEVVDLLHHPLEGGVGEAVIVVTAPDIAMSAGEPHLLDALALVPQRRREVGTLLVDRQCLATVLDARAEFTVGELEVAEFVAVDQVQTVEFRHAEFTDRVPDADHPDRRLVVVSPEASTALYAAAFLVVQPDLLGLVGRVVTIGIGHWDQARAGDERPKATRGPGATREAEKPDLVSALIYLRHQQIGVDHAVVQADSLRAAQQPLCPSAVANALDVKGGKRVATLDQMRADRPVFLDQPFVAGQHLEQAIHVGPRHWVIPGAIHANHNLLGHRFSQLSAIGSPMRLGRPPRAYRTWNYIHGLPFATIAKARGDDYELRSIYRSPTRPLSAANPFSC